MPHYYSEEQGAFRPCTVKAKTRGVELELQSGSGIFSKDKLDLGTKLLVNKAVVEPGWHVHDLGCGYGVVGIIVKKVFPDCHVVCSDVNKRAVQLTKKNAQLHSVKIDVITSDGYAKINQKFDTVLLNPPYVAGRKVVFRLIDEGFAHLKPGGVLQVVARHQKGGKMIREHLLKLAGNCDDSRKKSGFRIYVAMRD